MNDFEKDTVALNSAVHAAGNAAVAISDIGAASMRDIVAQTSTLTSSYVLLLRDAQNFASAFCNEALDASDDLLAKMEVLNEEMLKTKELQHQLDCAHRAVTSLESILSELEAQA